MFFSYHFHIVVQQKSNFEGRSLCKNVKVNKNNMHSIFNVNVTSIKNEKINEASEDLFSEETDKQMVFKKALFYTKHTGV